MTKDLAICVKGTNKVSKEDYLTTQEFLDKCKENLDLSWTDAKAKL
jgi:isocitrate dehydrogenase